MKLTESHLRKIIKEELKKVLNESFNADIHDLAIEYRQQVESGQRDENVVSVEQFAKDLFKPVEQVKEDLFYMITDDMGDSRYWLSLVGDPQSPEEVTAVEIGDPQDI